MFYQQVQPPLLTYPHALILKTLVKCCNLKATAVSSDRQLMVLRTSEHFTRTSNEIVMAELPSLSITVWRFEFYDNRTNSFTRRDSYYDSIGVNFKGLQKYGKSISLVSSGNTLNDIDKKSAVYRNSKKEQIWASINCFPRMNATWLEIKYEHRYSKGNVVKLAAGEAVLYA